MQHRDSLDQAGRRAGSSGLVCVQVEARLTTDSDTAAQDTYGPLSGQVRHSGICAAQRSTLSVSKQSESCLTGLPQCVGTAASGALALCVVNLTGSAKADSYSSASSARLAASLGSCPAGDQPGEAGCQASSAGERALPGGGHVPVPSVDRI